MERTRKDIEPSKERIIDIGCGPRKVEGAYGVDIHPYEGVDQVFDLDSTPWPLKSGEFTRIYARHIIEHVADVRSFMNEIHRIGHDGSIVEIVTPPFSSFDSWKDPTHRWHFSCAWYTVFTESYLTEQVLSFEHISTELTFGKSVRSIIPRLMVRFKGYEWWEKNFAFVYQARNIITRLRIRKREAPGGDTST